MKLYKSFLIKTKLIYPTYTVKESQPNGTVYNEMEGKYVPVYKEVEVVKPDKSNGLILDFPLPIYSQNVMLNGKDITYSLNKQKPDTEVIAKISVKVSDFAEAQKFKGYLGYKWSEMKSNTTYLTHVTTKKKDGLAVYDNEGIKTEYNGIDKDEPVKFCIWTED